MCSGYAKVVLVDGGNLSVPIAVHLVVNAESKATGLVRLSQLEAYMVSKSAAQYIWALQISSVCSRTFDQGGSSLAADLRKNS